MKAYIGIDPGLKGGIAIIKPESDIFISEMPIEVKKIDIELIYEWLSMLKDQSACFCAIEKAQSMPRQGVKSTFNYGVGYGKLIAVLEILQIPYQEISPQKWKKEFSLIKKDKSASIAMAQKLCPSETFMTERGRKMDGKAEAFLIAEYARRKNL